MAAAAPVATPPLPAEDLAAVAAATGVIPGFTDRAGIEAPTPEPAHRKRRAVGWVVLIVAVLAVFMGAAYGLNRYFDNQANVATATVPAVTGMSRRTRSVKPGWCRRRRRRPPTPWSRVT